MESSVLTDAEHEQKIVMLTSEPGSEDEARLRRALRLSGATDDVAQHLT